MYSPPTRETRNGVAVRVVNGWSNLKRTFDKSVHRAAPWTLHHLRRTFATNLAALGTPIYVTEKLLNHISGSVFGVAAIYNRHGYMDEMRAAIADWEKRLAEIVALNRCSSCGCLPFDMTFAAYLASIGATARLSVAVGNGSAS
jgi:hypothetical protein